ncbi:hypothetical protein, partial [Klebsiella pneumoniae]|uniref:hypothetical protein n=1 Tax=Klebsiella pneumoniae TaxID=573 RepID=UPI00396A9DBC
QVHARHVFRKLNFRGMNPNIQKLDWGGLSADVLRARNGIQDQIERAVGNRVTYDGVGLS